MVMKWMRKVTFCRVEVMSRCITEESVSRPSSLYL